MSDEEAELDIGEATQEAYRELETSEDKVKDFALGVVHALREKDDLHWESLEVGCRLDMGVAEGGRIFVNEVTRWYGAHYFSSFLLSEPKTQICQQYAEAFSSYCRSPRVRS
jgi:hypothetical protein